MEESPCLAELGGGRQGVALAKILQTPFSYGIFIEFSYIDVCSFTYAFKTIPRGLNDFKKLFFTNFTGKMSGELLSSSFKFIWTFYGTSIVCQLL